MKLSRTMDSPLGRRRDLQAVADQHPDHYSKVEAVVEAVEKRAEVLGVKLAELNGALLKALPTLGGTRSRAAPRPIVGAGPEGGI